MEKKKKYYECGDGWLPLIEEAEKIIKEWNDKHDIGEGETDTWGGELCKLIQVKEKWGELCLYCNIYPDAIFDKMIELGVGIKKSDEDEEDGQKLQKIKTKKKKKCCGGKKK